MRGLTAPGRLLARWTVRVGSLYIYTQVLNGDPFHRSLKESKGSADQSNPDRAHVRRWLTWQGRHRRRSKTLVLPDAFRVFVKQTS